MTDKRMGKETVSQDEHDDFGMFDEIPDDLEDEEEGIEDGEALPEDMALHGEEGSTEKGKGGFLKELLVYAVIIVLCITVVPRYVIQRTEVQGDSMKDNLHDQENLLVEKVSYYFKDPDRFDIITFYPQGREEEEYYIKRVIGLPGERIQISGNTIYVNGKVLEEHYGKEPMVDAGIAEEEIKLGEDEFFVLGDNRNHSMDSRDGEAVGVVKKKNIDGHAILRIYPFSRFGTLNQ
jgi:signal peptidase I, bacterial type